MSEDRALSDIVWTPERGMSDPEIRSISWNNLLLSDEFFGGRWRTSAEVKITPETALQSTVFLACCRIIAETCAGLPIHVYRRLKDGNVEIADDIPLNHVLTFAPNSWQTKFEFFEQILMNLTLWGNSYTEVKSGKYGSVSELNNLHPSRMRVERLENGRLRYSYTDPQTGNLMVYTQDQVMHIRWTPEPDGIKGMVPTEVGRDAIALSRACEIYASKFWANMGRPGVVLQTDGALSAETAERLRENWERIHRGVQNAYKTAVLTNGLKVESFGATNNESQFLDVRKFQCEEIARIFRLSLHLVQGQSGGNLEIQGQEFINYTLMPWLSRIEQAISRSLIYDDATYHAKFDTRGLLRGDSQSRASYYSTMMGLGVLSINDVRRAEGLSPLGADADKHFVAMNLQPLEEAVKPKPDPSMMPGFGSGAPEKAPGGPPSLPDVKTGKSPIASPKGEDSAKPAGRAEARELSPQDEKLEEAQDEIAAEDGKWSKESAHYIATNPFAARGIRCANCTHYSGDGDCGVVKGTIQDDGICKLWVIPQEKITPDPEKRALPSRLSFEPVGDSKNSENVSVPTDDELTQALTGSNSSKGTKIGKAKDLPAGTPVALRIDIPAFNWSKEKMGKGVYAVTVHEDKGGKQFGAPIGYEPMARLSGPVVFASQESGAEKIASGESSKFPVATVKGAFNPDRTIPKDIDDWIPVGYDPKKAAYFYDKKTGQEVEGGVDAVSVGNTVFTREPKYGHRNAKTHYRSLEEMLSVDSWGLESRAFCATGEGGGVDNSCSSSGSVPRMAADKDSSGGGGHGKTPSEKYGPPMKPGDVPHTEVSTTTDSAAFLSARDTGAKRPENFSELDPDRLGKSTKFISKDGKSGCLVDEDGDLGNVFNNGGTKNAGMDAVLTAIERGGAQTLDCYDDFLPWKYAQVGFVATAKVKWNDAYAQPNWDYQKNGRPDVVIMSYQGGDRSTIRSRVGSFKPYESLLDSEYVDEFGAAKRTARLSSEPVRRPEGRSGQHDQGEGRGVHLLDSRLPEGIARGSDSPVDALAIAPTSPSTRINQSDKRSDDFEHAKRVARLASDSHERGGRSDRSDDQGAGRGVRDLDPGSSEESVGDRSGTVDTRAFCPTGDGGGVDNSCSSKDAGQGSSGDASSAPRPVVNVVDKAIASPATTRSPDGKQIISSSIGSREDGTIYSFAGREFVSTVAAGKHLADQQAASRGGVINSGKKLSDGDRDYLVDSHAKQAQDALARGITPAFYTPEEHANQIEQFARLEPRVQGGRTATGVEVSPEVADFLYTAIQSVTSPNASPFGNSQRTDSVLDKFFNGDGRVATSTRFGVTGAGIVKSLSRFQAIVDRLGRTTSGSVDTAMGLAKARELFVGTTMRVADFDRFFRGDVGIEGDWKPKNYLVDQEVPLFSVFGPKVGPFFANNMGDHSHLTADIWATRTWGRNTGELVGEAKSAKAMEHGSKLSKIISAASVEQLHGHDGDQLLAAVKKMAKTGEIDDVVRSWSSERLKYYASNDYKEKRGTGGKLNKLAKNIVENDTSLMGDPGNGTRRKNMVEVYREVEKKVGLPVAHVQDVLWQDEQDAYAALGAKTATEQGKLSLYSHAIQRIADDPSYRLGRAKKERRDADSQPSEFYDDYERGGREELLYWEMISHLSDEQFVDLVLGLDGRPAERRAFCPTGDGGGVDNTCSSSDGGGSGSDSPSGGSTAVADPKNFDGSDKFKSVNIAGDSDRRLGNLGLSVSDAVRVAGAGRGGNSLFMRPAVEWSSKGGDAVMVSTSGDLAGVEDGIDGSTVIMNVGPKDQPEIVVEHSLLNVKDEIKNDPEKRHAAAREFYTWMVDSVEAAKGSDVSRIVLNAAGRASQAKDKTAFRGYTIWPRMGFNAKIPFDTKKKLPESLSHCTTLLDLHATPEGTRWWRDNGTDIDVSLDLTDRSSPQMQVFDRFTRHFSRNRRDYAYGEGDGWLSPADEARLDEMWDEIWDDGTLDDYIGEEDKSVEERAFCPTGEGGGIKNDCSSKDGGDNVNDSWRESDESVETWDREDLARQSPISRGERFRSFSIENPTDVARSVDSLKMSLDDVVSIGGTVDGDADVTVGVLPEAYHRPIKGEAVVVATSSDVSNIRDAMTTVITIHNDDEGRRVVSYDGLFASPKAQDKAAVACARGMIKSVIESVSQCEKHGVYQITLDAGGDAKSHTMKGYRIWPRFGFDGVIPRHLLTRLREQDCSPRAVAEKRAGKLTVQALYETKAGQDYWEKYGAQIPMWLRPGDESTPGWNRFQKYRVKNGESRSFEPGDEIFSEEELKKLDEMWDEIRKEAAEKRAFCPTGEGGGIDNSCGVGGPSGPKMAADKDSGGGSSSTKWGGKTEKWGRSSETEVWTPGKPLFPGAESFQEVLIHRPNDVKGQIEDGLKMTIADALLASGPLIQSPDRASITKPRLEIIPTGSGIEMHWTAMGVATGDGYADDERQYAPKPGTVVKAVEANRDIWVTKSGPVLHMGGFFIHPDFQGKGIGLESVLHSTSSPVVRLEMEAERFDHPNPNTRMTGYKAWPKYGYDAPIAVVKASLLSGSLPSFLSKAKTLSDVYATPGGREFWAEHGGPIRLVFDRSPRSRSWQTLLKYSDRSGKRSEGRAMQKDNRDAVGSDSDHDSELDAFWADVAAGKEKLSGEVMTQEEYDRWLEESKEKAKDGDSGEVRPH